MKYIIKDWAGNTMKWEGNEFESFEDAFDYLCPVIDELTAEELQAGDTEYAGYDHDELFDINLGEFQIIEIDDEE